MISVRAARGRWFIVFSFLIALALDVLPLPLGIGWFRPLWSILVLTYWMIMLSYLVGVGYAFLLGIILDLLQGTPLGMHAFVLVIIGYSIVKLHHMLRTYPLMQQTMIVCVLLLLYQLGMFLINGIVDHFPHPFLYWMSMITSVLLWPWLFLFMQGWRKKLEIG